MIAIKNVLVAVDFSEPSVTALEYGRAVARTFDAKLHVLHAVDTTMLPTTMTDVAPANYAALLEELEAAGRHQLDDLVQEDDRRELHAEAVLVTNLPPAAAIVGYARKAGVDLIVMGTHGRGMWGHLLMGSVAERVVRLAPCPVLTVRHPEHECLRSDLPQLVAQVTPRQP